MKTVPPALKGSAKTIWIFFHKLMENFKKHEVHIRASSIAYYTLLSIFPLILFALTIATRVLRSAEARLALHEIIFQVFPAGSDSLELIIDQTVNARSSIGLLGALGLLWTASSAFGILEVALSTIWGTVPRPFWRRRALGALSVLTLSIAFVVSFFFRPILSWVLGYFGDFGFLADGVKNFLAFLFVYAILVAFYGIYPNRKAQWRPIAIGALTAAVLMELGRQGFGLYIDGSFNNLGYVYGSITWILLLCLWAYLMAAIFFTGAEVAVILEEMAIFEDAERPT